MKKPFISVSTVLLATLAAAQGNLEISQKQMPSSELALMSESVIAQTGKEYTFENRFVIFTEVIDKKGETDNSHQMTILTGDEGSEMGIKMTQEGMQTELIYDFDKLEMVSLMNAGGQKMGTTMKIDRALVEAAEAESKPSDSEVPSFEKTGKSKEISGYPCDEYAVKGKDMFMWITQEAEADWMKSLARMSGMNKKLPNLYPQSGYPEDGAVIQMISNEENGSKVTMTVQEIETGGNFVISTEGYTFMNIGQ